MASSDPKLLYSIPGVSAYHISNGKEESLTPSPQTLSLLMVPTSSAYADPSAFDPKNPNGNVEDFYLHLHLPPELDLPLPATTQVFFQPPNSYLIPRWDLGPDSGSFTRLQFPDTGSRKGLQEDIDTWETIIAQCTAFLERVPPPKTAQKAKEADSASSSVRPSPNLSKAKLAAADGLPAYNPGTFAPGEAYVRGSSSANTGGQIVLIDEENGSVIGELGENYTVVADSAVKPGSKEPVEITLPTEGNNTLAVAPAPREYLEELHPAYQKSFLVSKAAYASRLIITTSDLVAKGMQSGADSFKQKTQPATKAVTFQPSTHEHVRKIGKFSGNVAQLSAKTIGNITKTAQNLGASMAGRKQKEKTPRGYGANGKPLESYKPGLLNKSFMAFSTISDSIEAAGKTLLNTGSVVAEDVVRHRWGNEAGDMAHHIAGSGRNVALVYIDVTGVSRKAVVKAATKGFVVGHVKTDKGEDAEVVVAADPAVQNDSTTNLISDAASISGTSNGKKPYNEKP